jgi:hypothetical protein
VKQELYPTRAKDWESWAKKSHGYAKRFAYELFNAGEVLALVHHGAQISDLEKLDALHAILKKLGPNAVEAFLAKHDVHAMEREALRDLINALLERGAKSKGIQETFWDYGRLPDPAQILLSAADPKLVSKLDFAKEAIFVKSFTSRAMAVALARNIHSAQLRTLAQDISSEVEKTIAELQRIQRAERVVASRRREELVRTKEG